MLKKIPEGKVFYAANQLDGALKALYDELVVLIGSGATTFHVHFASEPEVLFKVFRLVLNDHPEFYWAAPQIRITSGFGSKVRVKLVGSKSRSHEVDAAATRLFNELIASLPSNANEYTKTLAAFRLVVSATSYDREEAQATDFRYLDAHTMVGVFVRGKAVCDGYAAALQYLLQQMGILAVRVEGACDNGHSGPTAHAWVIARINGSYYHIDPTWADVNSSADFICDSSDVNYDYFCLTDGDIKTSHSLESFIALPPCASNADNYYRREGLLLHMWSEQAFVDAVVRQAASGTRLIALRAASSSVYKKLLAVVESGDALIPLLSQAWKLVGHADSVPRQYIYYANEGLRSVHIKI